MSLRKKAVWRIDSPVGFDRCQELLGRQESTTLSASLCRHSLLLLYMLLCLILDLLTLEIGRDVHLLWCAIILELTIQTSILQLFYGFSLLEPLELNSELSHMILWITTRFFWSHGRIAIANYDILKHTVSSDSYGFLSELNQIRNKTSTFNILTVENTHPKFKTYLVLLLLTEILKRNVLIVKFNV